CVVAKIHLDRTGQGVVVAVAAGRPVVAAAVARGGPPFVSLLWIDSRHGGDRTSPLDISPRSRLQQDIP
ncbi:Uncharacterized protein FKW44_012016, partial [Caligus rogercresseyi]